MKAQQQICLPVSQTKHRLMSCFTILSTRRQQTKPRPQMGHSRPDSLSSSWRCSDGVKSILAGRSLSARWTCFELSLAGLGIFCTGLGATPAGLGADGGRAGTAGARGRDRGCESLTFMRFGTGPVSFSPWDNIMCCFKVTRRPKLCPQVGQANLPCSGGGFWGFGARNFWAALCARTLGVPVGLVRSAPVGVYSKSLAPGATAFRRYSAKVRPFHASLALEERRPQVCAASPTSANIPSFRRSPSRPATVECTRGAAIKWLSPQRLKPSISLLVPRQKMLPPPLCSQVACGRGIQ